ncbi:MAG: hypothetical protein Q4A59_03105 [Erysipelotrichaceae bacterium]|nr:hypothetical protein [Erysipelotrichaceae bacterium]
MAKKSVYAALELSDREVRLVVSEVFNGRSNILRVERVSHDGIRNSKIRDENAVVKAIDTAVSQAQMALGYQIERVILAIPSVNVRPVNHKVHIEIEDGTHTIRRFHIQQGLKSAMGATNFENVEFVNVNQINYYIDGVKQDKIPLGVDSESFDMEVDFLCADKKTLYSYVAAVEKAGLQILDIVLDAYGMAKETGTLSQSLDKPVILVDLEADHTTLAFVNQNKIGFTTILDKGYRFFIQSLREKYGLSETTCWRLLENLFDAREIDAKDVVIYIEQQEEKRIEISQKELAEAILPKLRSWIADINAGCANILASVQARYVITGQGADIPVLKHYLHTFNAPAAVYGVTTIGARSGANVTNLGLIYALMDINKMNNKDVTSVNNNELEESIESITRYAKDQEGGFTRKLKKAVLSTKE